MSLLQVLETSNLRHSVLRRITQGEKLLPLHPLRMHLSSVLSNPDLFIRCRAPLCTAVPYSPIRCTIGENDHDHDGGAGRGTDTIGVSDFTCSLVATEWIMVCV